MDSKNLQQLAVVIAAMVMGAKATFLLQQEKSPELLDSFVKSELKQLSLDYKCKSPKAIVWAVSVLSPKSPAWSSSWEVGFSLNWEKAYKADPDKTFPMLRHTVAYEFGHWMQIALRIPIPLPKGPKWREARREYTEKAAKEFAEARTGISHEEAIKWWKKVTQENQL